MNNLCRATTHPFQYNQNPLQLFQARDKLLRWTSRSVLLNVSPQNKLKKREWKFWNRLAENKLASQGFFMVCLAEDRPSSRFLPNTLDLKYNGDSNNLPLKLLSHKKLKKTLTWIVHSYIVYGERLRGIHDWSGGTFSFVRWRSVLAIINQDGKQNHQKHLENTTDYGEFEAHF